MTCSLYKDPLGYFGNPNQTEKKRLPVVHIVVSTEHCFCEFIYLCNLKTFKPKGRLGALISIRKGIARSFY